MELTLKLFPFSSSFRFLLPLHARLVIMLTLFYLGENTVFCDGTLEAAKCSINRFIFTNFRFRHQFSLPPTITHNPKENTGYQTTLYVKPKPSVNLRNVSF